MGDDIRVCARDGEPLVFTMEFPGAENICVVCGALEGVLGLRRETTPDRRRRLDELTERYERERAQRRGVEYHPPVRVGDEGVPTPVCSGCGATPEVGTTLRSGKPLAWFGRTLNGVDEFACCRACIPARDMVLPW